MQGSAARIADTTQRGVKMKRKMDRRQNSDFETRISESVRWQRTENTGQRGQISVFKRKRFINSCRISICRSGCKRLRTFSRRSGSIAARSRTSLSRVLYLEYLLNPMRIVFSFLPTEMMPGRRRLRCYPRWVVIWTEADAAAVRLCDCADGQQKRP